jgi:hypothetical protein
MLTTPRSKQTFPGRGKTKESHAKETSKEGFNEPPKNHPSQAKRDSRCQNLFPSF